MSTRSLIGCLAAMAAAMIMTIGCGEQSQPSAPSAQPSPEPEKKPVVSETPKPIEQPKPTEQPKPVVPPAVPSAAQEVKELSQYGITWTFAAPAKAGKFVTGDWWVVGPVTVQSVTPTPAPGRHGSVVNPQAGSKHGYDDRWSGYDAAMAASFPLELKPGESLVTTVSAEQVGDKFKTPDTVNGQYCRGPVVTAAALTCLAEPPPADAFRPAFVGTDKTIYRVSQLRRDLLPGLKPVGQVPATAPYERYLQRIWLDHQRGWVSRSMHPWENMPDYGREITNVTTTVALLLLLEDPEQAREKLLLQYVQLGIDYWGVTQSDNKLWNADGGHNSGRKLPIIFAGTLLAHDGMRQVKALFAEDAQTYYGEGWHGQKALWNIADESRKHEHLPPEKWKGPPFKGDNDGWKSEAYRSLNGPTWVGIALAARLLGAKEGWGHDPFFDYVDRWVAEEKDGMVDEKTMQRKGYTAADAKFVRPMWDTYRPQADTIGAKVREKAKAGK